MSPATRDSGVGWLGSILDRWAVVPASALFGERKQKSNSGDVHLTPSQKYGVLPQAEYMQITGNRVVLNLTAPDNMRHVEAGDFVSHLRSFQGGLEYASIAGKVSAAYTVLKPERELDARYFKYLFKSDLYVQALQTTTDQLRDGQSIRYSQFKSIPLPAPAVAEQRAIADYLDRETAQIDAFIAKNEELIALLTERRRTVIALAVTGARDMDRPRRKSGAEWVEEVPVNWATDALVRTAKPGRKAFTDGDWIESPFITDEGVRLIQTGNVGRGRYKEQGFRYVSDETFDELRCTEVLPGDLLISRLGEPVARACIAPDLGVRMITSVDVCILRTREDIDPRWLNYQLNSAPFLDWVSSTVRGSTRDRVSRSMLGKFKVLVPPVTEQTTICDALDEETTRTDAAIETVRRATELARERRAALISATVTGKIDVGVAA